MGVEGCGAVFPGRHKKCEVRSGWFPCDVQLWGRRRTEVTKIKRRMDMDIDVEEEGKRRCKRDRGMLCCLPGRAKKCEVRFGWCCL